MTGSSNGNILGEMTFQMVELKPHHTLESDLAYRQGEKAHVMWECPPKMKMPMWGENVHTIWKCECQVRIFTWGENVHVRWECPFQMVKGTPHHTLESDLSSMWDENSHVRWECSHKAYVRWEYPWEVKMLTWCDFSDGVWVTQLNSSFLDIFLNQRVW